MISTPRALRPERRSPAMSSSAGSTMAPGDGSEGPAATKKTVVIGNLKRDVDKEALNTLLCQLGRVTNFRLQQPPGVDLASPATGIVEYASAEDATRVVAHVHGKLILGRPVTAWVPVPGSSPPPLPQVAPVPNASPNSGPTTGGPARAAYPGDMNNGARYPKPSGQISGNEDPRWERPPPPSQQGQRGPPPPGAYGDGYPHNQQQQQQQQQPWHPGGRPTPQHGGGGGAAAAAGASRFRGEGDPAHYAERRWQDQGHEEEDESGAWERSERHHYPPPAHRAPPPMRRKHPAAYHRPHASAGWYEEADSRGVAAHAAYGGGGGSGQQLRGPSGRGKMPRDASGGSAAVPPRGSDDGYGDEGIPAGKRRRPPPPGGMLPPGRAAGAAAAAWTEDAEYTVPPPAISIKGEDFEKEVVKAAALLVAEREMRAREEARKQGKRQDWPDGEAPPGDREEEEKNRTTEGKKKSSSKARGHRRSAGEEGKQARKKPESSSGRGGGQYQDDKGDDDRPKKKKRNRRDDDGSSPCGNGRADSSRADDWDRDWDRHSSNSNKRGAAEEGGPSSKGKPKAAREESRERHHPADDHPDRGRHRDVSRGRHKDHRDYRSRDKERHSSRSRPSAAKPAGYSGWDRDHRSGGGGDGGSPREGGPWEHSTADTGFYVHVGGLSFSTTFTTLAKRFAAFGDVNGFKVVFNKVSCSAAETSKRRGSKDEVAKAAVVKASSGFAFISFDNERGMEKAVECMDGQELDGHILKVTRGKSTARATAGLDAYRSQTGPISSTQRASYRRPEPRGSQGRDQQVRKVHKPQPRPGDRRQAPFSSTGSAAASSLIRDAQGSRGGGRAGGGGGGGGRNGVEKNRDPSPDPLGALRSPRPTAASRKEAPAVKLEANGRLKIGYGGKPGSRDHGGGHGGGGDGGGDTRTVHGYKASTHTRTSNTGTARPANTAGSDFYTSRLRRP